VVALLWLATAVQGLQIVAAAVMWRSSRERHDRLALPRPGEAIGLLRRSLPFAVAGVVANAQARLAPLALGYLASANDVALFGAAQRLGNFARLLPQSAFAGALPVIAGDIARGESAGARERFDRIVIGFAVLSSAALALFAPLLIRVTYGGRFSGGASVLVWVAIGLLPSLVNGARRVYLWAAGRETFATAWNAVAVAAQALASVLLIPAFGASGAAAALAVGECAIVWPLQHGNRSIQPRERVGGPVAVVVESPAAGL
jgi:O-antigen/teichoic acid export membrane protein